MRIFFSKMSSSMPAVGSSFRQISADSGYFIAVATAQEANIYTLASVLAVQKNGLGALVAYNSTNGVGTIGDLYKDMGKTVVAKLKDGASLTFRKIRYVDPTSPSTDGISGNDRSANDDGYNTGYILLGINGAGPNTTVTGNTTYRVTLVAKYGA